MASRLKLHEEFIGILESESEIDKRVYFQPPESKKLRYPCIRYSKDGVNTKYANNGSYLNTNKYEGVVIDPDPDSSIPDKILARFPMCSLGRVYTADNLNHYAFTLYY